MLATACALLTGCAWFAPPPPPAYAGPDVVTRLDHFVGSPLSGPRAVPGVHAGAAAATAPDSEAAGEPWLTAQVQVIACERIPEDWLTPASTAATLVAAPHAPVPLRAVAELTRGARFGVIDDRATFDAQLEGGDRHRELMHTTSLVLPGVTTCFELVSRAPTDVALDGTLLRPTAAVQITRSADTPEQDEDARDEPAARPVDVTLLVSVPQTVPQTVPNNALDDADEQPAHRTLRHEFALWQPELEQLPALLVIALPSPFAPANDQAGDVLVALIELSPSSAAAPDLERRLARVRADLGEHAQRLAAGPGGRGPLPEVVRAVEALLLPEKRRFGLVYLAHETGAPLAADVALTGGDHALEQLCTAFLSVWEAGRWEDDDPETRPIDLLGAALDRTAYRMLAGARSAGTLSPALHSVLLRHAGEVGQHAALVEELIADRPSPVVLRSRLVDQNLAFLEDHSPAARVRAYDWLAQRDLAPPHYDPLAPADERLAALRAAAERDGATP